MIWKRTRNLGNRQMGHGNHGSLGFEMATPAVVFPVLTRVRSLQTHVWYFTFFFLDFIFTMVRVFVRSMTPEM